MDILEEIEGLNDGKVYLDGNNPLQLVHDRVMAEGGKGSITIKVDMERVISEGVVAVILSGVARVSALPKRKPVGHIRFRDEHGNLTSHKPGGQQELPNLQAVETGRVEPRSIAVGKPAAREV